MKKVEKEFESLVGKIQMANQALRQDALVVINRSVTTRAWLTGYYIVEYEQHGADRAKYGTGLLKKLAAEKKAAEEKKKAEARARAAYRRKQRKFEENGLLEGFAQINWSFMAARDELKRRGFSLELMHKLKGDVVARISPWNKLHHADYVEYFSYQYYLSCSEVQIETLPADQQESARKEWEKVLLPFKRREPWL